MREPSPAASSKQPEENQKAPMASLGFLILLTSPPPGRRIRPSFASHDALPVSEV
jgi:hypothetical protein